MKFEFKLSTKKPTIKEPPQRPNPFDLLKTWEKHKEIIQGIPIATDAFGRTLYQTPNGQFRAIGDMFNLVANVYQLQNQFITLAPPPDDEEDTMARQKPKKQVGTIIIVPISPLSKIDACFTMWNWDNEKIYKLIIGDTIEEVTLEEIFDCSQITRTYNNFALGYFDKTAIALGYDEEWNETIYRIGYENNIISTLKIEDYDLFYDGKFTYYKNNLYFAFPASNENKITFGIILDDFKKLSIISELSLSNNIGYNDFYIWSKFIIYKESLVIKIYDYINKTFISEILIEEDQNGSFGFVSTNEEYACFVWTFDQSTDSLKKQHFVIVKKDGAYWDIEAKGIGGWVSAEGDIACICYLPWYQSRDFPSTVRGMVTAGGETLFTSGYDVYKKLPDRFRCKQYLYFVESGIIDVCFSSDGSYFLGRKLKSFIKVSTTNYTYEVKNSPDNVTIVKIVSSPDQGNIMLLYGFTANYENRIYYSSDYGSSWVLAFHDEEGDLSARQIGYGSNGVVWSIGSNFDHTIISENGGISWRYISGEEAIQMGLPVVKNEETGVYNWEYVVDMAATLKGTVFLLQYIPQGDTTKLFVLHGSGPTGITGTKPILRMFESDNGTFFAEYLEESYSGTVESYELYRYNSGNWELVLFGSYELSLIDIPEGILGVPLGYNYGGQGRLSKDNGQTWEFVLFKNYEDNNIEIYSLKENSPIKIQEHIFEDGGIFYRQEDIGLSGFSKIYNNKFYFDIYSYNLSTGEIEEGTVNGKYFFWLGNYIFYYGYDSNSGKYGFFVKDIISGAIKNLNWEMRPYYYPEHSAAYYLTR